VREAGLDPTDRTLRLALDLAAELVGFPRHLSQHVGGFVITRGPLSELVPIENAAMEDRTVIEWDKDDLDQLGILKIDVLALGMLTCIRKAFALIDEHHGRRLDLATVPAEDPAVYEMLSRADSLGVFQVESRAQMPERRGITHTKKRAVVQHRRVGFVLAASCAAGDGRHAPISRLSAGSSSATTREGCTIVPPVVSRPPSRAYHTKRFTLRNSGGFHPSP
jgi:Bacterial DNA polymerase III alpha NTPase domain/Bacterial DNA polymerase III alpha subunit finger domain